MTVELSNPQRAFIILLMTAVKTLTEKDGIGVVDFLGELRDLLEEEGDRRRPYRDDPRAMSAFIFEWFGLYQTEGMIEKLWKVLSEGFYDREKGEEPPKKEEVKDERTMIDLVVNFVKSPLASNRITNEKLEKLRKVILDPEEAAEFKNASNDILVCSGCRTPLNFDEVIKLQIDEEGKFQGLSCSQCSRPILQRCAYQGCQNHGERHELRVYCREHRQGGGVQGHRVGAIIEEAFGDIELPNMERIQIDPPRPRRR